MTETRNEKLPARKPLFSRLISVLIHPGNTFSELFTEARGTWLTPMLALTLSAILVSIVSGYLKTRAALAGEITLPPDWEFWTPEMQDNFMQAQQTTQGPMFMYILPLIGSLISLWLGWVIFSAILRLASTLLGGRGSMLSALNVVAWASLPFLVRDGIRIFYMLIVGHAIVSPGLSGFVNGSGFASVLLAHTDLFLVWNVLLLGMGFSIADGLPKSKAFAGVLVIVLLTLFTQAGIGALTSSFSSSGVQRPFF
jgi:hypothetical protein